MYSLNRSQLIGNVVREPEVRQTSGGQVVANFSVATNRSWKDASGVRQDSADFHNVVVWGKLAEIVQQYVSKGRKIYVEGRMQTRSWEGEDGQKRYRTEVVAENIILLDRNGSPSDEAGNSYSQSFDREANSAPVKSAAPVAQPQEEEVALDDLPF